ncbi:signal peptidase complex catalytic subunit sec11c [Lasius niger]|uniref:Signal peptidase complex catalytic subunit SEC11 n=1 Tax=Lasius niger TaxID=67767 RepID=A0A0J7KJC0_LASNI|nr:signal peptidase complex catalytic subunit sec11c [Lasius niger]
MVLFNSANPEGKNIGVEESCSNLNRSKPIVFLVHGFISSANTTNTYDLASQLVKKNYTVFSLDWSNAACDNGIPILRLLEYPQAVKNTREIGELMAKYVVSLIGECKIPLNNITFIGHSLGAHVCGFAAEHIQKSNLVKISLIIGLDPAAPLFEFNKCEDRLCKSDATHVITLHTSPLGISKPIGHVHLQFNGGTTQPDCGLDLGFACSHSKSIVYLANSLNNCVYPGVPIKSSILGMYEYAFQKPSYPDSYTTDCIVVTEKIFNIKPRDKLREGNYYVFVEPKSPYCTQKNFSCKSLTIKNQKPSPRLEHKERTRFFLGFPWFLGKLIKIDHRLLYLDSVFYDPSLIHSGRSAGSIDSLFPVHCLRDVVIANLGVPMVDIFICNLWCGSMEPAFHRGDLLFLTNYQDEPVRVGEIVVFKVEGRDIPIVHRVLKLHEKGDQNNTVKFLTKGDNNSVDDRGLYAPGQLWLTHKDVVGRARGFLPYVGMVTIYMNEYPKFKYAVLACLGLYVLVHRE